jgi:hypothetical protein
VENVDEKVHIIPSLELTITFVQSQDNKIHITPSPELTINLISDICGESRR